MRTCDFKWQCGCPRMLKVVRLWDAYPRDVFEVSATDHEPRHGCCHTLAPNACDFSGNYETTPSLAACLKIYIQLQTYHHGSAVPWSALREGAEAEVANGKQLHCLYPHPPPRVRLGTGGPGRYSDVQTCPGNRAFCAISTLIG